MIFMLDSRHWWRGIILATGGLTLVAGIAFMKMKDDILGGSECVVGIEKSFQ
jgi:hypothetical protein